MVIEEIVAIERRAASRSCHRIGSIRDGPAARGEGNGGEDLSVEADPVFEAKRAGIELQVLLNLAARRPLGNVPRPIEVRESIGLLFCVSRPG
jgi:hypothetical protein